MNAHTPRMLRLLAVLLGLMVIIGACMPAAVPDSVTVPEGLPAEKTRAQELPASSAPAALAVVPPADIRAITNIVWQWTDLTTVQPAATLRIGQPELYTLTLLPQNQVSVWAECNTVSGIYAAVGDRITIQLGPSTGAYCGPQSNDQLFLDQLTQASTWEVVDGSLRLTTTDASVMGFTNGGPAESEQDKALPPFANALWEWIEFRSSADATSFYVVEPEQYTALFAGDAALILRADCNRALGSFVVDGASLAVKLGPTTLADCGPDSLYDQYLRDLSDVVSYVMEGDLLILNLKMDAGDMVFRRAPIFTGTELTPDQVSIDAQAQVTLVMATPYDASMPPGPVGLPEHIQITPREARGGDLALKPGEPVMYVLPVNAYREQWQMAGDEYVAETMQEIFRRTVALPNPPPTSGMPALPPEQIGGVNDVAAQIGRLVGSTEQSASRDGYRFVGRWAQDANPIVNGNLRYVYQGFTNDGKNLVSFWYPVTTPLLPDAMADLPEREMAKFSADPQGYISAQVEMLNTLSPDDFEPSLDSLDALVASLRIEGMPIDGLSGFVWRPVAQAPAPGERPVPLVDPLRYSVSYYPGGSLSYQADCNVGTASYIVDGAVTGSIQTQLGPTTTAACSPDSWGQELINTLTAAQDFRVLPGGFRMQLIMPAGGPVVTFVKVGPAEEPAVEPEPTIVLPPPAPVIPTGRVIGSPGVNVRAGPGTDYPIVGFASYGSTGQIVGRSEDDQWWATPLSQAPNGLGWLSGAYVQVSGVENVPIILAPPPPPTAMPTATSRPTMVPTSTTTPTRTAAPTAIPEIAFWADRYQINQGQCAQLSWRASNVAAVWVYPQGSPYQNYRQPDAGSQVVCPALTTTYEMRVQQRDGRVVFQQVTIQVRPSPTATRVSPTPTKAPPTATRVPPTVTPTRVPSTATPVPPTPTKFPPTLTPVPPTATPAPPTATPIPPTATAVPPTPTPEPYNPLANTTWLVTRFEGFGVPIGDALPGITFTADGRTEIFGGCNTYQGTYTVSGNQIAILVGPGTSMFCDENVMAQEMSYIRLLTRAARYEMPGAELILSDSGGMELLRFMRRDR